MGWFSWGRKVSRKEVKDTSESSKSTFKLSHLTRSLWGGPVASKTRKEPPRTGSWGRGDTIWGKSETLFSFLLLSSLSVILRRSVWASRFRGGWRCIRNAACSWGKMWGVSDTRRQRKARLGGPGSRLEIQGWAVSLLPPGNRNAVGDEGCRLGTTRVPSLWNLRARRRMLWRTSRGLCTPENVTGRHYDTGSLSGWRQTERKRCWRCFEHLWDQASISWLSSHFSFWFQDGNVPGAKKKKNYLIPLH